MPEESILTVMDMAQPAEEKLRCPACASTDPTKVSAAGHDGYGVRRCLHCHLLFSEPMLAADSAWYLSSWLYGLREENTKLDGRKRAVPWNFGQALSVLRPAASNELLDVGCAEGHFLWLAQEAGFNVTGLDFNPHSLQIAKEVFGISSVYQCSVEELARQFPCTSYDVVTLFEVLEHTADPFETLCSLNKVLKPGGQLCLSVPGFRRWPVLFHPVVDAPPHHLTLWTEEALQRLLGRAGFRVLTLRAKPLQVDDLGVHLKWRLQEVLRKFQRAPGGEMAGKNSSLAAKPPELTRSQMVHRLAKGGLAPICWALRFNPRAGGFTLFANCQKI
jgi:SAM-dependent methyltransferase